MFVGHDLQRVERLQPFLSAFLLSSAQVPAPRSDLLLPHLRPDDGDVVRHRVPPRRSFSPAYSTALALSLLPLRQAVAGQPVARVSSQSPSSDISLFEGQGGSPRHGMPALWLGFRSHPPYVLSRDRPGRHLAGLEHPMPHLRPPDRRRLLRKRARTTPPIPPASLRARLSEDVPADLAAEYWTASQVLPYSEEASAAISRRLLQRVLSGQAGAGYGGLAEQMRAGDRLPGDARRISRRPWRRWRQGGRTGSRRAQELPLRRRSPG